MYDRKNWNITYRLFFNSLILCHDVVRCLVRDEKSGKKTEVADEV